MLRRLSPVQPDSFAFTPANLAWAEAQTTKFPEGRQQSAVIPLLWRAQEQEGWLSRPAIEYVAGLLGMAYMRVLEVATFYFMFQLHPVGRIANIQVCGTTTCMISGSDELREVCRSRIAPEPHTLSPDGAFSWEEVECLGACANAPMAQIGKDYYEDLTPAKLEQLIDAMAAGKTPLPGPQNGRFSSEAQGGATSLVDPARPATDYNASVALAAEIGDTLKRIDGTEVPLVTPWQRDPEGPSPDDAATEPRPSEGAPADATGVTAQEAQAGSAGRPVSAREPAGGPSVKDDVAPGASNKPLPPSDAKE